MRSGAAIAEPFHKRPAPFHKRPAPFHKRPAPFHKRPAPLHKRPAPFHKRPAPLHAGRDSSRIYRPLIPVIRDAAWLQGYLAAPHGTLKRDLDIIAVPWIECASTPWELANAIAEAVGCPQQIGPPSSNKPHGRVAWSIILWNCKRTRDEIRAGYVPWVDLSVMPKMQKL